MGDCGDAHTERFRGRRPTVGHVCADVDVGAPGESGMKPEGWAEAGAGDGHAWPRSG